MTRPAAAAPLLDRCRDRLVLLRLRRPRRGVARLSELHRDVPASAGGASPSRSRSGCCWPTSCCRACTASSRRSTCRLLHRPRAHERRPARRPGEPRVPRRGRADPRSDESGGMDRGRCRHPRLVVAHRHVDAHPAQLRRGAGQPAVPLRPPAGLRVPAGGRRQPRAAPSRAVLEMPRRLAAPGRLAGRLARGGHVRHGRRSVAVHPAGHAPASTPTPTSSATTSCRRSPRPIRGSRSTCSRTSRPAITRETAAATASAPTATCRSSTSARRRR